MMVFVKGNYYIMSNSEFRARAKELLQGKYKTIIIFSLILMVITGVVTGIGESFAPQFDWVNMVQISEGNPVLNRIFDILISLLSMVIAVSLTNAYIKIINEENVVLERDLMFGFTHEPVRTIIASFLQSLYTVLWMLLFIIPGFMKAYSYTMVQYLLVTTDLDATETITKSKNLMKGHRMDLFMLDLSYLPEYFIGLFTLGILWFWTGARHQTARTLFIAERTKSIEETATY